MKPTTALKPLVFALAAVMAIAAQAGGRDNNHGNGNGHGNNNRPQGPTLDQILSISAGAGAVVMDSQAAVGAIIKNEGTQNGAAISDSLNGSNGNMGANVAAGDGNQQDNAAALATADESFIFGNAIAVTSAGQVNHDMGRGFNNVNNFSNSNAASLNNSGNNGSGNIGMNVTSGSLNQQKNNLAIAVSGGRVAQASASTTQASESLLVFNSATPVYTTETLTGTHNSAGSFVASGTATTDFVAVGVFGLAGVTTQQVMTPNGWKNPVTNVSTMTNSLNGFSGNGGANVSSGSANQQSNSLSIAAGCRACL